MNLKTPALALALGGLFVSGAVLAGSMDQQHAPKDPPAFDKLDVNGDGAITPDEARGNWLATAFSKVDANKDGRISQPEYEKATS